MASLACADPYENGTPTWGSEGMPEIAEKKGNKLSCSCDDSVEGLRPKKAALSKTRQRSAENVQQPASSAKFWCPFAKSRQAEAEVAASR